MPTVNAPGENYLDACERVARCLEPLGFATRLLRAIGTPGDSDRHPRWNLLARREGVRPGRCVHFNALGREPDYVVSPGTYDQKHIDRVGRLKNCIAYGPGILDLAHQPDEYVVVDDMLDAAVVMGLALGDLLEPES